MVMVKFLNCHFYGNISLSCTYITKDVCKATTTQRQLNIEFLQFCLQQNYWSLKYGKNEKAIISNLEKVKKRKVHSFDLHKKSANENYLYRNPFFVSWKKRLGDGQFAIRYKMRSRAIWQWASILKLGRSIVLV